LRHNYPNPFNPTTIIEFTLEEESDVLLTIFDLLGREILTLVNARLPAGRVHQSTFNASSLPSGVYVYKLEASHLTDNRVAKRILTNKLMFIR
jgi:hypothetical protein